MLHSRRSMRTLHTPTLQLAKQKTHQASLTHQAGTGDLTAFFCRELKGPEPLCQAKREAFINQELLSQLDGDVLDTERQKAQASY